MADLLELLATGRRAPAGRPRDRDGPRLRCRAGAGRRRRARARRAVRRAGAQTTRDALAALLDPGLEAGNPLDVWGTGADTRELFAAASPRWPTTPACRRSRWPSTSSRSTTATSPTRSRPSTPTPRPAAARGAAQPGQRARPAVGRPAAGGWRPGAGRHPQRPARAGTPGGARRPPAGGAGSAGGGGRRRTRTRPRWLARLAAGPLSSVDSSRLLRDYGLGTVEARPAVDPARGARRRGRPSAGRSSSRPTRSVAHKSDVRGVHLGLADPGAVTAAYRDLAERLGPARAGVLDRAGRGRARRSASRTTRCWAPLVVVGAGGVLVELLADRVVALPPVSPARAGRLLDRLACRPLLDGAPRPPGRRPGRRRVRGQRGRCPRHRAGRPGCASSTSTRWSAHRAARWRSTCSWCRADRPQKIA